ncbi:hypothetical protein NR756_06595 [Alloalcanivorax xenomutans]|uniref:hypothetical protein n=1 Tax=Alloalcanivorax xenomutans TaxID=1094342 RepID=UPI003A8124DB
MKNWPGDPKNDEQKQTMEEIEANARLAVLDTAIERGLADIETARTHSAEDVLSELRERYKAMDQRAQSRNPTNDTSR